MDPYYFRTTSGNTTQTHSSNFSGTTQTHSSTSSGAQQTHSSAPGITHSWVPSGFAQTMVAPPLSAGIRVTTNPAKQREYVLMIGPNSITLQEKPKIACNGKWQTVKTASDFSSNDSQVALIGDIKEIWAALKHLHGKKSSSFSTAQFPKTSKYALSLEQGELIPLHETSKKVFSGSFQTASTSSSNPLIPLEDDSKITLELDDEAQLYEKLRPVVGGKQDPYNMSDVRPMHAQAPNPFADPKTNPTNMSDVRRMHPQAPNPFANTNPGKR